MVSEKERTKDNNVSDEPPYSRLFVVYNRKDPVTESELRTDFGEYGEVQDIFIVKDRNTGESKGVAYVKFPKMSEAAQAMEKLNNTPIKGHSGVYKVYIAKSRGEARGPDYDDPDRYMRVFVMVPKSATEDDVRQHFSKFGDVTTVKLLRHKDTNESRGLGYVTYARVYDAAKAVESGENESGYKAIIARPKEKVLPADSGVPSNNSSYANSRGTNVINNASNHDLQSVGDSFQATVSSKLDKDHIFRLFDIAPGLRNIQIISQNVYRTDIVATYTSSLAAEYALNKLQGLEYPLGECICVESKGVNKTAIGVTPTYNASAPIYNVSAPSFNASAPSHNSNVPTYNPSAPSYNPSPPSYSPAPSYNPPAPSYNPPPPSYSPAPSYNPTAPNYGVSSGGSVGGKRDYRGEQIIEQRSASPVDPNCDVNQKLSALTKALSDAATLLKTAGISTGGIPTGGISTGGNLPENHGVDKMSDRCTASTYCDFPLPPPQKVLSKSSFSENTGMRLFFVGHPTAPPLDALYDVYCRFGNFAGASILSRKNYGYLYFNCPGSAVKAIEATDDKVIAGVTIKVLPAEPKGEPGPKRKKTDA